jgi:hypothetical protein
MPLHDWTDERGWDSVHPLWLAYLVEWIQPRFPEGYKAFLGGVPALTVASGNGKPQRPPRAGELSFGTGGRTDGSQRPRMARPVAVG